MAATPSAMVPLGTIAPNFTLFNTVTEEPLSLKEAAGERGTVIMFICNHCPYVKHVNPELVRLAKEYEDTGVAFIAISSNDVENYPQDHPELMQQTARELDYPFPYLYDEDQSVAKAFNATCTPDFFVFDGAMKLVYRGQLDDSRPGNDIPLSGKDIRTALARVAADAPPLEQQVPSIGCNIKWK
jgi:thiol-disulfide isomerase/thioredoxin